MTRWTIRVALSMYVLATILRLRRTRSPGLSDSLSPRLASARFERSLGLQRLLWSLGCLMAWAHVACAFAFYHHWSHAEAYAQTARETAETTGLDWGGGLYFNYLFMAVWTADAAWWWIGPATYQSRPRWITWVVQAYLAFIAFNATVVFETGPIRYVAVAAAIGIIWLAVRQWGERGA